ncbi:MAG: hypothetical protein ABII74_07675 [Elusimicrobiota bacterium]
MIKDNYKEILFLTFIGVISFFFLFKNLGDRYFWDDEAETVLLAKSVAIKGYPHLNFQGAYDSAETKESLKNPSHLWLWNGWAPLYLTYFSFNLFGENNFTARFPFALIAWFTIFASYFLFKKLSNEPLVAKLATIILVFFTPFLLYSRQCRYYSLVMFTTTLFLIGCLKTLNKENFGKFLYVISGFILFQSFFAAFYIAFSSILLYCFTVKKKQFKAILLPSIILIILCLPNFFLQQYWQRPGNLHFSIISFLLFFKSYSLWINNFLVSGLLLAGLITLWIHNNFSYKVIFLWITICSYLFYLLLINSFYSNLVFFIIFSVLVVLIFIAFIKENYILCSCGFIFLNIIFFSLTAGEFYGRYLAGCIPLGCLITGKAIWELSGQKKLIVTFLLILIIFSNFINYLPVQLNKYIVPKSRELPNDFSEIMYGKMLASGFKSYFTGYLTEISKHYKGPTEITVQYLNKHSLKNDSVLIFFGDLIILYYTKLKIWRFTDNYTKAPEWIIWSSWSQFFPPEKINKLFEENVYQKIELNTFETVWDDSPDLLYHRFQPPVAGNQKILFRRISK